MKFLLLSIILSTNLLLANDQIAYVINDISPHIDNKISKRYAIIVEKYSESHNVDWRIAVAIFKLESDFDVKAANYQTGDFGIGQMNHRNIVKRKLSLGKLLTDADYAIGETFLFLKELKEKYNTNSKGWYRWYTRYHSFTPEHRMRYFRLLARRLLLIERALSEQKRQTEARNYLDSRGRKNLPNISRTRLQRLKNLRSSKVLR